MVWTRCVLGGQVARDPASRQMIPDVDKIINLLNTHIHDSFQTYI